MNKKIRPNYDLKAIGKKTKYDEKINDSFYSESNVRYLERILEEYKSGKLETEVHELIEPDCDDENVTQK